MSIAIATMGMFRPVGTGGPGGTTIVEKIVEVGGGYSGLGVIDKRKPTISATLHLERKIETKVEVFDISEE